jgi:hypothetical protein
LSGFQVVLIVHRLQKKRGLKPKRLLLQSPRRLPSPDSYSP